MQGNEIDEALAPLLPLFHCDNYCLPFRFWLKNGSNIKGSKRKSGRRLCHVKIWGVGVVAVFKISKSAKSSKSFKSRYFENLKFGVYTNEA